MSGTDSWRQAFEQSARRYAAGEGPRVLNSASIDAEVLQMPLEPEEDEGLNDLHRAALRGVLLRSVAFTSSDLEYAAQQCESPIERAMLYALSIVAWEWCDGLLWRVSGNASGTFASQGTYVEIEPQASIDKYRVDFLLTMSCLAKSDMARRVGVRMVVECDGHEWHERSRAQAQRDRTRDRVLQSHDLAVFRYTGADIWRDVFTSARDAVAELRRRFDTAYRAS